MRDLYSILNLKKEDAPSAEEIKKAYRKRTMETHPDTGGDPELFREVQTAYDILGDEKKRKAYDESGDAGCAMEGMTRIEMMLKASAAGLIERAKPTVNLIAALKGQIMGAMETKQGELKEARAELDDLRKFDGKHTRKGGGVNVFAVALEELIRSRETQIAACIADLEDGKEMLLYLDAYEFHGPKPLNYARAWGEAPRGRVLERFEIGNGMGVEIIDTDPEEGPL